MCECVFVSVCVSVCRCVCVCVCACVYVYRYMYEQANTCMMHCFLIFCYKHLKIKEVKHEVMPRDFHMYSFGCGALYHYTSPSVSQYIDTLQDKQNGFLREMSLF